MTVSLSPNKIWARPLPISEVRSSEWADNCSEYHGIQALVQQMTNTIRFYSAQLSGRAKIPSQAIRTPQSLVLTMKLSTTWVKNNYISSPFHGRGMWSKKRNRYRERERDELHFYKEDMASPSRKLLPIYTIVTKLQVRQVFTTFSL